MFRAKFLMILALMIGAALAGTRLAGSLMLAQDVVKIADPTSVVMIVNRDSNDLGFMDIKTHKMVAVAKQQLDLFFGALGGAMSSILSYSFSRRRCFTCSSHPHVPQHFLGDY